MYKFIITLLCCYGSAYACDFCGGSPAVMNSDVLSLQPQSSVGTSVQYRNYKYLASADNVKRTQTVVQNFFVSYSPKKWVDIRVSLPIMWTFNEYIKLDENTTSLHEKKFGLSDMIIFSNFRVWQKSPIGRKVGQVLNLGFGISVPTGSKKTSENALLQDFNFGTQTVGFLFSAAYSLSIKKWGLVNSTLVKINLKNKDNTLFGNQYTYQLTANYTTLVGKVYLIPVTGLGVNYQQRNIHHDIIQSKSGAIDLEINAGLQCNVKGITFAATISQPLVQKTGGGNILQKTGFNCFVKYQIPHIKQKMGTATENTSTTKQTKLKN